MHNLHCASENNQNFCNIFLILFSNLRSIFSCIVCHKFIAEKTMMSLYSPGRPHANLMPILSYYMTLPNFLIIYDQIWLETFSTEHGHGNLFAVLCTGANTGRYWNTVCIPNNYNIGIHIRCHVAME